MAVVVCGGGNGFIAAMLGVFAFGWTDYWQQQALLGAASRWMAIAMWRSRGDNANLS